MRICVFCGSSAGLRPNYLEAARSLGQVIATAGHTLVYGGARVGLMGAVADAALAAGGAVIGVIPRALVEKELAHSGLTELHVVGSMHERKAMFADLSNAFVALPGGVGTLEELFEVWTWGQLGYHAKPVALLNVAGFYRQMVDFLDFQAEEGFVRDLHRTMLIVETDPHRLLDRFRMYEPPPIVKWIEAGEE